MEGTEITILNIYQLHHAGVENAIKRDKFQKAYWYLLAGVDDRKFRKIYAGLPILTCSRGGYWPKRRSEVLQFMEGIDKRRDALKSRRNMVLRAHHRLLNKPEQQRLFQ